MLPVTRTFLILILGMILCSCVAGVKPEVRTRDLKEIDTSLVEDIVLTKRVALERTNKTQQLQGFEEKVVDEVATSRFGKEHKIANVGCIVAGIKDVLKSPSIISATEFWEAIGGDLEMLELASLFEAQYSQAVNLLDMDYMVISYHQRFDVSSHFVENIIEGGYADEDKEVVSAITIDMKSKRIVGVIEIDATHKTIVGHITPIPFAFFTYPDEDPCKMAGRLAAETISRSITKNITPRIGVVAAKTNPYSALEDTTAEGQYQLYYRASSNMERLKWLCNSADRGYPHAQAEVGRIYKWGLLGIPSDQKRAYVWYSLAIKKHPAGWEDEYLTTRETLSPEQLLEAEEMLADWEPGQCERHLVPTRLDD